MGFMPAMPPFCANWGRWPWAAFPGKAECSWQGAMGAAGLNSLNSELESTVAHGSQQ